MKDTKYATYLFILTIVFGLAGFLFLNNKIASNEHPAQKEWLEVYITHRIKTDTTDLWRQRIAIRVAVFQEEIIVTLSSANGQEEISQPSKDVYISAVEGDIRRVLKDYPWARNYKVIVQYL